MLLKPSFIRVLRALGSAEGSSKPGFEAYRACSSGATLIEYAVIAGIMASALVAGLNVLDFGTKFTTLANLITAALAGP